MNILLLNGPPRCGKDTIGNALAEALPHKGYARMKFAHELKKRTHALYGICNVGAEGFEAVKDTPSSAFLGLTPRQAYINVSEKLMKPVHGEDVFGQLLAQSIISHDVRNIIITDSGFAPEAEALLDAFGFGNTRILQVLIKRPGTDFSNDSRSYWDSPRIPDMRVMNYSTVENAVDFLIDHGPSWISA